MLSRVHGDVVLADDPGKFVGLKGRWYHSRILRDLEQELLTQILKVLSCTINLYKKASLLSDKVLKKYMYITDINEFKNEKILGKLRDSNLMYQELNEMTEVFKRSSVSINRNRFSYQTNKNLLAAKIEDASRQ